MCPSAPLASAGSRLQRELLHSRAHPSGYAQWFCWFAFLAGSAALKRCSWDRRHEDQERHWSGAPPAITLSTNFKLSKSLCRATRARHKAPAPAKLLPPAPIRRRTAVRRRQGAEQRRQQVHGPRWPPSVGDGSVITTRTTKHMPETPDVGTVVAVSKCQRRLSPRRSIHVARVTTRRVAGRHSVARAISSNRKQPGTRHQLLISSLKPAHLWRVFCLYLFRVTPFAHCTGATIHAYDERASKEAASTERMVWRESNSERRATCGCRPRRVGSALSSLSSGL